VFKINTAGFLLTVKTQYRMIIENCKIIRICFPVAGTVQDTALDFEEKGREKFLRDSLFL
jgi:hypothetical protein